MYCLHTCYYVTVSTHALKYCVHTSNYILYQHMLLAPPPVTINHNHKCYYVLYPNMLQSTVSTHVTMALFLYPSIHMILLCTVSPHNMLLLAPPPPVTMNHNHTCYHVLYPHMLLLTSPPPVTMNHNHTCYY